MEQGETRSLPSGETEANSYLSGETDLAPLGSGEAESIPQPSGETEPALKASGETEFIPWPSGETEPVPIASGETEPNSCLPERGMKRRPYASRSFLRSAVIGSTFWGTPVLGPRQSPSISIASSGTHKHFFSCDTWNTLCTTDRNIRKL